MTKEWQVPAKGVWDTYFHSLTSPLVYYVLSFSPSLIIQNPMSIIFVNPQSIKNKINLQHSADIEN